VGPELIDIRIPGGPNISVTHPDLAVGVCRIINIAPQTAPPIRGQGNLDIFGRDQGLRRAKTPERRRKLLAAEGLIDPFLPDDGLVPLQKADAVLAHAGALRMARFR
jgi:hypothetical protein